MRYQIIIFDMDGTILDTLDDLKDSLNYALRLSGMPERSLDEVRGFVGNGIQKLIDRGVPKGTPQEDIDRVLQDFTAYYREHSADKTKPYDGIIDVITSLKNAGLKIAVVSNKIDFAVGELCDRYFSGLIDAAVGEKPGVRRKPMPDSVNAVLEQMNIDRQYALYVGDSDVDIHTAENAGIDCVAVEWGFRDREFLYRCGAKKVISSPYELEGIIRI